MHSRFATKTLFLTAALSLMGGASRGLHAAEKGKAKEKTEERAPLVLKSEASSPSRDLTDRVGYAAVIKQVAPSLVAIIANRKDRAAPAPSGTPNLEDL